MKRHMNVISESLSSSFRSIFCSHGVNLRARETRFSQREAKKLTGYDFLLAMTLGRFKKCAQQLMFDSKLF